MPNSQDARFDRLETLIDKGFSALAQDIADTKSEVVNIKSDLAQFRIETREAIADVRSELKNIRNRLDALESAVHNISGYAKEIDHLMERVSVPIRLTQTPTRYRTPHRTEARAPASNFWFRTD